MAQAVEDAKVVCCFMTPEYQKSDACKKELTYADNLKKRIIPCVLVDKKKWWPTGWLGFIITGKQYINFCDISDANIRTKVSDLIARIKSEPTAAAAQSLPSSSKLFELTGSF
jgi:hypothetical protein